MTQEYGESEKPAGRDRFRRVSVRIEALARYDE
jgi:hypothetical protein